MKEFDFDNVGKRMPYKVPEGFFEKAKMQARNLDREVQRLDSRVSAIVARVAVAAAVVIAICGVAWWSTDYHSLENRHTRLVANATTESGWDVTDGYETLADIGDEYFY